MELLVIDKDGKRVDRHVTRAHGSGTRGLHGGEDLPYGGGIYVKSLSQNLSEEQMAK